MQKNFATTSNTIIKANPHTIPPVASVFPSAQQPGISSAQETATMAPAEKESAHGRSAEIAPTASAPSTPAAISTHPENCP